MPKNDYVKLVIDARYLNSVTDLTNNSWPLEPVQMIMTRVNGKIFPVGELSCAFHQVPLTPETLRNLPVLSSVDNKIPTLEVSMVYAVFLIFYLFDDNSFRPRYQEEASYDVH